MLATQIQEILQKNDELAASNRSLLRSNYTLLFELAGLPGSGRTTLLAATLRQLYGQARIGLILSETGAAREHDHLAEYSEQLVKLDVPVLDARAVNDGLRQLDLDRLEWIFVLSTGLAEASAALDLGQNLKAAVFGVAGGDDKPLTELHTTSEADAVVLTQADLLRHVPFDLDRFHGDLRRINASAPLFCVSALHGHGMAEWTAWLRRFRICKGGSVAAPEWERLLEMHGEWYFG